VLVTPSGIRSIVSNNNVSNITSELIDYAIFTTKPILVKYANHPDLKIRDRVIHLLLGSEPDEREIIITLLDKIDPIHNKILDGIRSVPIKPNDLPVLLSYLNHDSINLRSDVVRNLGKTGDSSILPILLNLIHNPELEVREAAAISIVKLGMASIFTTVVELANNSELVAILINELGYLAEENPQANIFK
jgi:HEAT repeat protein